MISGCFHALSFNQTELIRAVKSPASVTENKRIRKQMRALTLWNWLYRHKLQALIRATKSIITASEVLISAFKLIISTHKVLPH